MSESTNEAVRIVGISGSLRKASFNTALLKILAEKSASSINIQVVRCSLPVCSCALPRPCNVCCSARHSDDAMHWPETGASHIRGI